MTKQLWSNERIGAFANNAPSAWEARRLYDALCKLRDDYEAKLAEREWQPVEDKQYGSLLIEDNGDMLAVALYDDDGQRYWQGCHLNNEFRVCRRVAQSDRS